MPKKFRENSRFAHPVGQILLWYVVLSCFIGVDNLFAQIKYNGNLPQNTQNRPIQTQFPPVQQSYRQVPNQNTAPNIARTNQSAQTREFTQNYNPNYNSQGQIIAQPSPAVRNQVVRTQTVQIPTAQKPMGQGQMLQNPAGQNQMVQSQAGQPRQMPVHEQQQRRLLEASVSPAARQEAIKNIPWNSVSPQVKAIIQSVLSEQTLYRRLPQQRIYCDPVVYNYFITHPDVAVAIWEKLGITQISLKEQGQQGRYVLRENVGSAGNVEVLYRNQNTCIIYSKGSYKGQFIPNTVEGETILILKSSFEKDENGEPIVVAQLDSFVKLNNFGVDLFAKLFAPMLGKVADNNFEQTMAFIENMSESAQANPELVKRMALKLETIRKEVRDDLIKVAYQTAQNSIDRAENLTGNSSDSKYFRELAKAQQNLSKEQIEEFERDRAAFIENNKTFAHNNTAFDASGTNNARTRKAPEPDTIFGTSPSGRQNVITTENEPQTILYNEPGLSDLPALAPLDSVSEGEYTIAGEARTANVKNSPGNYEHRSLKVVSPKNSASQRGTILRKDESRNSELSNDVSNSIIDVNLNSDANTDTGSSEQEPSELPPLDLSMFESDLPAASKAGKSKTERSTNKTDASKSSTSRVNEQGYPSPVNNDKSNYSAKQFSKLENSVDSLPLLETNFQPVDSDRSAATSSEDKNSTIVSMIAGNKEQIKESKAPVVIEEQLVTLQTAEPVSPTTTQAKVQKLPRTQNTAVFKTPELK
ncbi:MAG: hypothetical protein ACRC2T_12115 [Thermoguttaceae bacterium]